MKRKMMKKVMAVVLAALLTLSLAACKGAETEQKDGSVSTEKEVGNTSGSTETPEKNEAEASSLDMSKEVTLNILGPGLFADIGEEDKKDLVTGDETQGYHVVVERWNELYPNVTLNIEPISWDNWQSVITTACLSGDVDVILHGASMVDMTEDLTPYIEATEGFTDSVSAFAIRHDKEDLSKIKVSGMPYTVNANAVWLDVEKFENFGVKLPDASWTFEDVLTLAEQLTGTDPVTGKECYGLLPLGVGDANLPLNFNFVGNALGVKVYDYKTSYADTVVDYIESGAIDAFALLAEMGKYMSPEAKEGAVQSIPFDSNADWAISFTPNVIANYKEMKANGTEEKYQLINLPCAVAGDYSGEPVCYLGDNNIAIYKDSSNKDWAWEFIKFMTSDSIVSQWILDAGAIPNSLEAKEKISEVYGESMGDAVNSILTNVTKDFISTENQAYCTAYGTAVSSMTTTVSNLFNGYMTPEEAAEYMQQISDEYKASLDGQ